MDEISKDMWELASNLEAKAHEQGALRLHVERLKSLGTHFPSLKSFKSCLSCLMLMPEKVFDCGHSICNVCVRRFGDSSRSEKHAFVLTSCILCGQIHAESLFRLTPPTAGIRILCIDGGGVRGVIPLTFLQHIEQELVQLGCPIREYFDYVCGTSAGKALIISGIVGDD